MPNWIDSRYPIYSVAVNSWFIVFQVYLIFEYANEIKNYLEDCNVWDAKRNLQ